jgi:addiction module RelB/DinJ family antitoxin
LCRRRAISLNATVRVRVDELLKSDAEHILKELGLTISQAIKNRD